MFKRLAKFINEKGIKTETVNLLVGFLMLLAILGYSLTQNQFALYAIIVFGAFLNVVNGFINYRIKEKRTFGMSMILLGIVILVLFAIFLSSGLI